MTLSTLTNTQVDTLLLSAEGHFLDFKDRKLPPAKLSRSVSAFANADGGEIYVGISEMNGRFTWTGFETVEYANGHLQMLEKLFPLGQFFQYDFLTA